MPVNFSESTFWHRGADDNFSAESVGSEMLRVYSIVKLCNDLMIIYLFVYLFV